MAFDPVLPKILVEEHAASGGHIRAVADAEKDANREKSHRSSQDNADGKPARVIPFRRHVPLRHAISLSASLAIFDVAFIGLALIGWTEVLRERAQVGVALALAVLSAVLSITFLYAFDAYRSEIAMRFGDLAARALAALCLSGTLLFVFLWGVIGIVDAAQSAVLAILNVALSLIGFAASRAISCALIAGKYFTRRILVVGSGKRAAHLKELMGQIPCSLMDELTFVNEAVIGNERGGRPKTDPLLHGDWESGPIEELSYALNIDEIVVAIDDERQVSFEPFLSCKINGIPIVSYGAFIEREAKRIDLARSDLPWLVYSGGFRQGFVNAALKRALDIVVSAVLLFISAPVMLIAMAAVASGRDGPVFFKQQRVTKNGRLFWLYKIRTMRQDAERNGPQWSSSSDPRVTYVGAILRRFRIDEIPQLVNVLKGEMSLVGPRPEQPYFVEQLSSEIRFYNLRHTVKAGVTGWAQIHYPYGATKADAIRKLEYELYYIKNYSFLQELSILLQTVRVLFWPPRAN